MFTQVPSYFIDRRAKNTFKKRLAEMALLEVEGAKNAVDQLISLMTLSEQLPE